MEAVAEKPTTTSKAPRKGLMSRFRRKKQQSKSEQRERTPSPTEGVADLREGAPRPHKSAMKHKKATQSKNMAPSAREAAFGGTPRYDWIDIETAAAVKVQAAFRRRMVLKDLERQGISTAAIRNRRRRRAAQSRSQSIDLWNCCGVGLAWGEEDEDQEAWRERDRRQYQERKEEREAKEAALREQFIKKMAQRHGRQAPAVETAV